MAARVLARVNTLFRGQGRAIPAILPCAPGVTRGYATYDGSRLTSMAVGDSISVTRTFTEDDVQAFADLSGDHNPLHLDKEYAKKTRFGRPIVHGVLINSLLSGVLGTQLPGEGSIFLWQEVSFKAPLYVGDAVTGTVTVTELHPSKPVATFETKCFNDKGELLMIGQAKAMIRKELYDASRK